MEARPTECRAADEQLTELLAAADATQVSTITAREMKGKLVKHIFTALEVVVVRSK